MLYEYEYVVLLTYISDLKSFILETTVSLLHACLISKISFWKQM